MNENHKRTCSRCHTEKPLEEFTRDSRAPGGRTKRCKECTATYARRWHHANRDHHNRKMKDWWKARKITRPEHYLWEIAKRRAKESGRAFTIRPEDLVVPKFCPALGIRLQFGAGRCAPCSPSVDAIIPELGYVPGNVAVISFRANSIKQNASPAEIRRVADWLEKTLQSAALLQKSAGAA